MAELNRAGQRRTLREIPYKLTNGEAIVDIRFDSDAQETKNRWCRAKRSKQAAPGREWLIYYDTGSEMRGTEKNEKK